jgi:hypothetical protein
MAPLRLPTGSWIVRLLEKTGSDRRTVKVTRLTLAVQKRARAKNAQNCFLYRLLLVVVARTFGFQIKKS